MHLLPCLFYKTTQAEPLVIFCWKNLLWLWSLKVLMLCSSASQNTWNRLLPNTVMSASMHVEDYRDCANFIFLFVWMKLSQTSKVSRWYLLTPVSSHWSSCLMWILASLERCCVEMHSLFCTIPGVALPKQYLVFSLLCLWVIGRYLTLGS